jgi:hypothetical protein
MAIEGYLSRSNTITKVKAKKNGTNTKVFSQGIYILDVNAIVRIIQRLDFIF